MSSGKNVNYWFAVSVSVLFGIFSLAYLSLEYGSPAFNATVFFGNVILPAMVAALGFLTLRWVRPSTSAGKSVLFLSLGMLFWGLGDVAWSAYKYTLISLADILYLLGYLMIFIALVIGIRMSSPDVFHDRKKSSLLIGGLLVICLAYFYFYPLSWDPGVSFIENLVTAGYVIADLMIIVPAAFLCYSLFSGELSGPWILILVALVIGVAGDMWYISNYELYEQGGKFLADLGWYAMYFLFAYSFLLFRKTQESAESFAAMKFSGPGKRR